MNFCLYFPAHFPIWVKSVCDLHTVLFSISEVRENRCREGRTFSELQLKLHFRLHRELVQYFNREERLGQRRVLCQGVYYLQSLQKSERQLMLGGI